VLYSQIAEILVTRFQRRVMQKHLKVNFINFNWGVVKDDEMYTWDEENQGWGLIER